MLNNKRNLEYDTIIDDILRELFIYEKPRCDEITKLIGEYFQLERCFIFNYEEHTIISQWNRKDSKEICCDFIKGIINDYDKNQSFIKKNIAQCDEKMKNKFIQLNIKTLLLHPLLNKNKEVIGAIGTCIENEEFSFNEYEISVINNICKILSKQMDLVKENFKYREVFNNTGTAIAIVNKEGIIIEVNNEYVNLTNFKKSDIENKIHYELLAHKDDVNFLRKYHRERVESNKEIPNKYETRVVTKENEIKNVLVNVRLIPESDKKVVSLVDLTKEKKSNIIAEDYFGRYKSLFEESPSIIILIDPHNGNIIDANSVASNFYGYSKNELLSMSITDLSCVDKEVIFREMKNLDYRNKNNYEVEHKLASGEIRYVEINLGIITVEGKKLVVSIGNDVTEEKQIKNQMQHRLELENIITKLSSKINSSHDPNIKDILKDIRKPLKADKVFLLRTNYDMEKGKYTIDESFSEIYSNTGYINNLNFHSLDYLMNLFTCKRDIIVRDAEEDKHLSNMERKIINEYNINSFIILPIYSMEMELLGAFGLYSINKKGDWGKEDLRFLNVVRDMIRNYWIREENEKEIKRGYKHLENLLDSTVKTLSSVVEIRDPYTAGHQLRVAELAVAIAEELDLTKEVIETIYIASILHDIGKIKIPSEILNRPGKISDIEFKLIQEHAQIGYDILRNIPFESPIADIIIQHHEKLDGSGYPKGLEGNDICMEAKIITVADVVEAISSHRPYRASLGIDTAIWEINKYKGIRYDEKIVDVCTKLFNEGKFKFDNLDL